mmetsp:Transcript_45382/g.96560  ORF Transcript_45382/g.96560 Transcript_45382/m.96560 type:complete len:276 (+) Transcript_45382:533-1360(+)
MRAPSSWASRRTSLALPTPTLSTLGRVTSTASRSRVPYTSSTRPTSPSPCPSARATSPRARTPRGRRCSTLPTSRAGCRLCVPCLPASRRRRWQPLTATTGWRQCARPETTRSLAPFARQPSRCSRRAPRCSHSSLSKRPSFPPTTSTPRGWALSMALKYPSCLAISSSSQMRRSATYLLRWAATSALSYIRPTRTPLRARLVLISLERFLGGPLLPRGARSCLARKSPATATSRRTSATRSANMASLHHLRHRQPLLQLLRSRSGRDQETDWMQ